MFTIDLLKGTGRPARTRWWQVAVVTLAFVGLGGLCAYGYVSYEDAEGQIAGQTRIRNDVAERVAKLGDVESFLKQYISRKGQLQGEMDELSGVLKHQIQWSPILTAVALKVPEGVIISDILIRRQEKAESQDPKQAKYEYVLVIGVIMETADKAIETFVNDLRSIKADQPRLRDVRVANQKPRQIQKQDFQSFVIECRFE